MKKRFLAVILTLAMVLALCPAAGAEDPTDIQTNIPADAVEFQGHYYKIYTGQNLTWKGASDQCVSLGGYLATITSVSEQNFIEDLNKKYNTLWIGGYRDDNFNWYWLTEEAWNYTNWDDGEPNGKGNEKYVAVSPRRWNDLSNDASGPSGYICEWGSAESATSEFPSLGESPIQSDVLKDTPAVDWADRLDLPDYAEKTYNVISGDAIGDYNETESVFETQSHFDLAAPSTGEAVSKVDLMEGVDFSLMDMYAGGSGLDSTIFQEQRFYTMPVDAEVLAVDYTTLNVGDFISTANFNGVYVTKVVRDSSFDSKKVEVLEYLAAVYQAFDRDHPEIFWLSGKNKASMITVTDPDTGVKETYFFLVLTNKDGFTMLSPAWQSEGSIAAGITRRDTAVSNILKTVTAASTVGKIKQLNQWLTEHNQYNTTADLTAISNEPHECLAALEGMIGTNGPVCDGYTRAFKVLCDQLDIPCVLETGWARPTTSSTGEFHMWSVVQVSGTWYGADITWDDPADRASVRAKSGMENENFLLVGADSVVGGLKFSESHVVKNQAAVGGVDFSNGPVMSAFAYTGPSFVDVKESDYFYDSVAWAVEYGIVNGTTPTTFSPHDNCTQVQILTLLWRAAGQPESSAKLPFTLRPGLQYADGALRWAYEKGMIGADFDQDSLCLRSTAVKFMWQDAGSPPTSTNSGFTDISSSADYAQAVTWAVSKRIINGTSATTFSPNDACTRAHIVTILYRAK